jgi:DnaK suppressor protein
MVPTTDRPARLQTQLCTHLSTEQLAALRDELERLRAFRADQLIQLAHPHNGGPLTSTNREVARTLFDGARTALHAVQAALWRMDEGTYGLCAGCRNEIDTAVLQAVPYAALCLDCQQPRHPARH